MDQKLFLYRTQFVQITSYRYPFLRTDNQIRSSTGFHIRPFIFHTTVYINDLPKPTRLADTLQRILVSFTPPLNMLPLSVIKHKNIFILYLNLSLNLLYYSLVFYLWNKLKSHFSSSKTSCVSSDKFKSPCTLCTFLRTIEYPSHF